MGAGIRAHANQHVTIALDPESEPDDIYKVFVCPPMRLGPKSKKVVSEAIGTDSEVTIDSILSKTQNILLIGKRQSSKTSVGHYLAVKFAEGLGDIVRVPIILDARTMKPNEYSFRKAAISYLIQGSLNQSSITKAIDDFQLTVILDNFDEQNDRHIQVLSYLLTRKATRIICICNETTSAEFVNSPRKNLLESFQEVRLEPLPRKSIRQLSAKRNSAGPESAEVFSSVMTNLVSAQLPWNGYIVSLLLWAHSQNKTFDNINEAVLIEAMVNFLLEKGDFSGAFRKSFDSRSKEITLQAIAVYFTQHNDMIGEKDLYDFVFKFFKKKGLAFSTPDTISRLIEIGILAQDDESISFRFRAFQEYFFACAMKEDDDLRRSVSDLSNIAFYAREIDLFTSNTRKSLGFMHVALDWIEAIRMKDNRLARNQDLEAAKFSGSGKVGLSGQRRRALKKDHLTIDQIDESLEKAEQLALKRRETRREEIVKSKNGPESNGSRLPLTTNLFLAIETLGKIVRNSEFDDLDDKIAGIEFYIDFCQEIGMTIFSVFDEAVSIILENKVEFPKEITEGDLQNIKNIIKIIVPVSLTNQISEQIGTEKLIAVIESIILERCNTFGKRVFLSCLLFDLRAQGSIARLLNLAKANPDAFRRHIIHEKLCINYNVRRFREADESELENAIADIEILLGTNKSTKGASIEARRGKSAMHD